MPHCDGAADPPSAPVWFITGVSRGLGSAIARAALNADDRVVGTERRASGAPAVAKIL